MRATIFVLGCLFLLSCGGSSSGGNSEVSGPGIPEGAITEPYDDGSGLILVSINNASGELAAQGNYLNGKKHGNWTEFHPSGLISTVVHYENGKREGLSIVVDNTGQVLESTNYHNDEKHGMSKTYVRNRVKSESPYVEGKIEGIVRVYYDNGTLMEQGVYKNGQRHGMSKWYDQGGNLTIEYEYDGGRLVK